jgi:cysteine desulfurase
MAGRLSNATLFAVEGMKAETAVIAFDLEAIAVSSGAACSSGKVQPSHVLAAMEISPALVRGVVRVRLGWRTGENAFLPLGEGLRRHYIEATISSPKWLHWRTVSKIVRMVQTVNVG